MKLLLALLTGVGALVVSSNGPRAPRATALSMSAAGAVAGEMSKSKLQQVVKGLTKETFETIYEHEAWIEANAGRTLLAKTVSRLQHKAKAFGVDLRPDFAAGARCTEKRREKQDAYVKGKIEAVAAASAECATALADATESGDKDALAAAVATADDLGLADTDAYAPAKAALADIEAAEAKAAAEAEAAAAEAAETAAAEA